MTLNPTEEILLIFLVPAFVVLFYIAGKYDIITIICKMLEQKAEEFKKPKHHYEEVLEAAIIIRDECKRHEECETCPLHPGCAVYACPEDWFKEGRRED